MSTHITGITVPDAEWRKKADAFEACISAGVKPPQELYDFFGGNPPDHMWDDDFGGIVVNTEGAVTEWQEGSREGVKIDLSKIPEGVTHVLFYNSW